MKNSALVIVVAILLIAFQLRIQGLNNRSIWWDEGFSIWLVRQPLGMMLDSTARDVHPPLYFLFLKGWWQLVGEGEFVLRFLTSLTGVIQVAAVYGLARTLGGRWAGILSALFISLSIFIVTWSQEIRMHILSATMATFAVWSAVRLWRGAGWRAWLVYVFSVNGTILSFYLAVPVPVLTNLIFLLVWLRQGRPRSLFIIWSSAQVAAALLFLPWLLFLMGRVSLQYPSPHDPFTNLFFLQYYTTTLAVGASLNPQAYFLPSLLVTVIAISTLYWVWRWQRAWLNEAFMLVLGICLTGLLVYIVAKPLFSSFAHPLYPRYFLPLAFCFYVLLGWGLALLAQKYHWLASIGALVVVSVSLLGFEEFFATRIRRTDGFISLSNTIEAYRQPDDKVLLHSDQGWPMFDAQYADDWEGISYWITWNETNVQERLLPVWENSHAVWLVKTPGALQVDLGNFVEKWLAARAIATETWDFGEQNLTLYIRTEERAALRDTLAQSFIPPAFPQAEFTDGSKLYGAWLPLSRYRLGDIFYMTLYWESLPQEMFVELEGMVNTSIQIELPVPAKTGLTRQQVAVPLTSDLPSGDYQVNLKSGHDTPVPLGKITLLAPNASSLVSEGEIPYRINLRLGDSIELLGYNTSKVSGRPSDEIFVTLYWRTQTALTERYKVNVHLLGDQFNPATGNTLWAQHDAEPLDWTLPTTRWLPGTIITDPYRLMIDANAPPGLYKLELVMYGLVDGVRLPVYDANGDALGDIAVLQQFQVE